jgi:hypothetical protein
MALIQAMLNIYTNHKMLSPTYLKQKKTILVVTEMLTHVCFSNRHQIHVTKKHRDNETS